MASPSPPQLPRMRRKEITTKEPPVLGQDPRRFALSIFLQAVVLGIVVYQMRQGGTLTAITNYAQALNPWSTPCGLLPHKEFFLVSDNVVLPSGAFPGYVHVRGQSIVSVTTGRPGTDRLSLVKWRAEANPRAAVMDYGPAYVAPGLIDVHVHLNTPGRDHWEGVGPGTAAAAAGGLTTVIDMPLNSDPCTVSAKELRGKRAASRGNTEVDLGAWGGIVPANARDPGTLRAMRRAGALGFKSFLSPSGMHCFPNVSLDDVAAALPVVKALGVPYLIHAELVDADVPSGGDPRSFGDFLERRPARFEHRAVRALIDLLRKDSSPYEPGFSLHIVHLVSSSLLPELAAAKAEGLPLTVETAPHYLLFSSEDVADGDTRFSCMPPIRSAANREGLWAGVADGTIDVVASDHSPSPPHMKRLEDGDFTAAWGGIAGLQYSLPASWDGAIKRGVNVSRLFDAWAARPAALAGLARKGKLRAGYDADVVVFDGEELADTGELERQHRHKVTPYDGVQLRGRVLATFVRGQMVFSADQGVSPDRCGKLLP